MLDVSLRTDSILEDSQVEEQRGVAGVGLERLLCGLKPQLVLVLHMGADVREHFGDAGNETRREGVLVVVDGGVDEQTDGGGERDGVGLGGKKKGRLVLLCVVPVPGDEVERLGSNGKELIRLLVEFLARRPVVAHALEQPRHPDEGFVPLLEPPSHLEAQVVVVVGLHEIVQAVIGLG